MTKKGLKYLADILYAIDLINNFTSSISSFAEYEKDLKTQSAVERQLGIIGEAVNEYDSLHPDKSINNARQIVGLRNRIVHAYDAIDQSIIWMILNRYLDPLRKEVLDKME